MIDHELTDAVKRGDCEIIPPGTRTDEDLKREMTERSCKAGHTTKFGECPRASKIMTLVAFGKVKFNQWPRDKDGQLIE